MMNSDEESHQYPSLRFRDMNMNNPYINFPQDSIDIPRVKRKPKNTKNLSSQPLLPPVDGSKPFLVSERGHLNKQKYVVRKKRQPREYASSQKRIDNELEADFPVHKEFDFVAAHAEGFKGKMNIDLFKFYYRLYMKNKFFIQKIRRAKKERIQAKIEREKKLEAEAFRRASMIRRSIIVQKTTAEQIAVMRLTDSSEEKDFSLMKPLEVKQFIIEHGLEELRGFEEIFLPQFQVKPPPKPSQNLSLPKIEKPPNVNRYKSPQLSLPAFTVDQQQNKHILQILELQQLFIMRIKEKIKEVGIDQIDPESIRQLKEVIDSRRKSLTEMQRTVELEQLLKLKKKIFETQKQQDTREQQLLKKIQENERLASMQSPISKYETFHKTIQSSKSAKSKLTPRNNILSEKRSPPQLQQSNIQTMVKKSIKSPSAALEKIVKKPQLKYEDMKRMGIEESYEELPGLSIISPVQEEHNQNDNDNTDFANQSLRSPNGQNLSINQSRASAVLNEYYIPEKKQRRSEMVTDLNNSRKQSIDRPKISFDNHSQSLSKPNEEDDIIYEEVENPLDIRMNQLLERLSQKNHEKERRQSVRDQQIRDQKETMNQISQDLVSLLLLQTTAVDPQQQSHKHITNQSVNYEMNSITIQDEQSLKLDTQENQPEKTLPINSSINKTTATMPSYRFNSDYSLPQDQIQFIKDAVKAKLLEAQLDPTQLSFQLQQLNSQLDRMLGCEAVQEEPEAIEGPSGTQSQKTIGRSSVPKRPSQLILYEEDNPRPQPQTEKAKPIRKSKEDPDYINFYNQNAENLNEGRIIAEMRQQELEQEQKLKKYKIEAMKQTKLSPQSPNFTSKKSSLESMAHREKGKKKVDKNGKVIEEKVQRQNYKHKELQAEQQKHQENLKKLQQQTGEVKDIVLNAKHVELEEQKAEVDEELEFLNEVILSGKSQRENMFQQFKSDLKHNREKKHENKSKTKESEVKKAKVPPKMKSLEDIQEWQRVNNDEGTLDPDIAIKAQTQILDKPTIESNPKSQIQKSGEEESQPKIVNPLLKTENELEAQGDEQSQQLQKVKQNQKNDQLQSEQRIDSLQYIEGEQEIDQRVFSEDYKQSEGVKTEQSQAYSNKLEGNYGIKDSKSQTIKKSGLGKLSSRNQKNSQDQTEKKASYQSQSNDLDPGGLQMKLTQSQIIDQDLKLADQLGQSGQSLSRLQLDPKSKTKSKITSKGDLSPKQSQKNVEIDYEEESEDPQEEEQDYDEEEDDEADKIQQTDQEDYNQMNQSPSPRKVQPLPKLESYKASQKLQSSQEQSKQSKSDSQKKMSGSVVDGGVKSQKRSQASSMNQSQQQSQQSMQISTKKSLGRQSNTILKTNEEEAQDDEDLQKIKKIVNPKRSKKLTKKETKYQEKAVVEEEAPETPKKKFNLKDELDNITKKNLTLKELKNFIENKIKEIAEPDDETKYNVYLFQQRQKQLGQLKNKIDQIVGDGRDQAKTCHEQVQQYYDMRQKYKEATEKDKALKFQTLPVAIEKEDQDQEINMGDIMDEVQANVLRLRIIAQQNVIKETLEDRREIFKYDSEQLKRLRQVSELQQYDAEYIPDSEKIDDNLVVDMQPSYGQINTSIMSSIKIPMTREEYLESLRNKLRKIKSDRPDKFKQLLSETKSISSLQEKEDFFLEKWKSQPAKQAFKL